MSVSTGSSIGLGEYLHADLFRVVAGFRRRMQIAAAIRVAPWGLAVALLAWLAGEVLADATLQPVFGAFLPAAGAAGGLFILAFPWARRPRPMATALEVDRRLNLKERISTAVDLSGRPTASSLAPYQIADAVDVASGADTAGAFPIRPSRAGTLIAAAAAALLAVWMVLPPEGGLRSLFAGALAPGPAASPAPSLAPGADAQSGDVPRAMIAPLRAQADLKRLEAALEQLRGSENPQAAARKDRLSQVGEALRRSRVARDLARSLAEGDLESAARALRELAERVPGLSESERRELAGELEQAASMLAEDQEFSDAFSEGARALEESRSRSAAQALEQLAGRMQDAAAAADTEEALRRRINDLQKALAEARSAAGVPGGTEAGEQPATGDESGSGPAGEGDAGGAEGQAAGLRSSAHGAEVAPEEESGVETRLDAQGNLEVVEIEPNQEAQSEGFKRPVLQLGRDLEVSLDPSAGELGSVKAGPDTIPQVPLDVAAIVSSYFSPPEVK